MGRDGVPVRARLSFVVPLFQEVQGTDVLGVALVDAGGAAVDALGLSGWEAVLVDDGSTDGSGAVLDRLAAEHPQLRVVHHPTKRGLGAALATGVAAVTGDVVVYLDADLPFDLDRLSDLVVPLLAGTADVVSAQRRGRAREGRRRAVQSYTYNALVRVLFGLPYRDVNFACKAARAEAVPPSFSSRSGLVDVEWLSWAHRHGLRVIQPRVEFRPRTWGRSTLGGPTQVPEMLREMLLLRRRLARGRARPSSVERSRLVRRRILARYGGEPRLLRAHLRARFSSAPLMAVADAVGPATTVVDLGCGHGLLSLLLAERGHQVLGADVDPVRVEVARRAAEDQVADLICLRTVAPDWQPPLSGAVVVADVLYLLPADERRALVRRAVAALAPGGRVVILGLDDTPRWKSGLARAQELVVARILTHPLGTVGPPPPRRQVEAWLRAEGLSVTSDSLSRRRPWPHFLAVGRRPPES